MRAALSHTGLVVALSLDLGKDKVMEAPRIIE